MIKVINYNLNENGLRERTLKLIEFLLNQNESANVSANDVGGFSC